MFDGRRFAGSYSRVCFITALLFMQSAHATEADDVHVYPAISDGTHAIIEGRVVEHKNNRAFATTDRKRDNFRRSMDFMINNERKDYPVAVTLGTSDWRLTTDREGYFRVETDAVSSLGPGWHAISATTAHGVGSSQLLIVPSNNVHGLISDVDDTIQVTEVGSKRRMLANTFLRNAVQREVVAGVIPFYDELTRRNPQPELAPIVYLSASPRQLHPQIAAFLAHNQFPPGALITKRVTDDRSSEPLSNQVAYKTKKIEEILALLPNVRFTLVGDDGERDPEIYADIQKRFPDRVDAVWIRKVNPDPKRQHFDRQGVLDEALSKYLETAQ